MEQEKIDSAMRMIEDGGLPLEKVALYSGLTLEQVKEAISGYQETEFPEALYKAVGNKEATTMGEKRISFAWL